MEIKGKKFLVVGYGLSGQAAAHLLALKGARVTVIDEAKEKNMKRRARRKKNHHIQIHFGAQNPPSGRFDAVVLSPGLDPRHGLGAAVMNMDVPIYGELELGSWFCQCPMIAITGTNGKTTTTELIEKVLRSNRKRVAVAGNIGTPLSGVALRSDALDYIAVEVSSFQLETVDQFRPQVSVLMNITSDHLDRYHSMEDYARTKGAIWKNQCGNDVSIINLDTERMLSRLGCTSPVRTLRYSTRGEPADLWWDGNEIRGELLEKEGVKAVLGKTRLRGAHNAENIMAALLTVHALGLKISKAWKAICDYHPLAHRLEMVGCVDGIEFVNDSKATNPDAMEKAVESFPQSVILIAGGKDKGFDFAPAAPVIARKVKSCILIGETRERIFQAWKDATSCVFADSLEEAVQMARKIGQKGDVVLLSPACSSFDMFENYEERGEIFRRAVQKLESAENINQP